VTQGSVPSPVLFNARMDENVSQVGGKNRSPDKNNICRLLIWRKDKKETEKKN
jgi:hypothetical protein